MEVVGVVRQSMLWRIGPTKRSIAISYIEKRPSEKGTQRTCVLRPCSPPSPAAEFL